MEWRGESVPVYRDAGRLRCSWRGLQITAPDIDGLRDGVAGAVTQPAATYAELARLIPDMRYRPGWRFLLHDGPTYAAGACAMPQPAPAVITGAAGPPAFVPGQILTLVICALAEDTAQPGQMIHLEHRFAVPPEGHVLAWPRWLLDRCLDVDRHEAMEVFEIGGRKPFYPAHGPDGGLYDIIEYGT